MSTRTIACAKFVGTVSLGLLTGLSYTQSTLILPSLLTLPSAAAAHTTFTHLRSLSTLHAQSLTALTTASLFLAYALSPARGRHPYLLWVCVLTGAGTSLVDALFSRSEKRAAAAAAAQQEGGAGAPGVSAKREWESRRIVNDEDSEDYDREEEEERERERVREEGAGRGEQAVNGEQVRGAVERFRKAEAWRTVVAGTAFAMGVVGIWGDAF